MRSLLKRLNVGKILRSIELASPWLFALPAVFLYAGLLMFKILSGKRIKFVFIYCERIGHLAAETELFMRRLRNGVYDEKVNIYVGFCSGSHVSNRQLLKMFKKNLFVIENWWFAMLISSTWLKKTQFYHKAPFRISHLLPPYYQQGEFNHNEYYEFNNYKPILSFTSDEELEGKNNLAKMGIGEKDWFVCFHARDYTYLNEKNGRNNYRNCNIESFMQAAEYIVGEGGYVIRMGAKVEKPLLKNRDRKIIDYAVEYHSDFMDIYLSTHCKFFIGSATGLVNVPTIFNVSVVIVNECPFEYGPFRNGDLFIPKLYLNQEKSSFLTAKEILDSGYGRSLIWDDQNIPSWLKLVDHSSEEIYEVVREMNLRIDGKYAEIAEEKAKQKKFRDNFQPKHIYYGSPAKIGAHFLRKYSPILVGN